MIKIDKKLFGKKSVYLIVAFLIYVLILSIFFVPKFRDTRDKEYSIVVMGDSIIGRERGETSVTYLLQQKLGKDVFNAALGGTTVTPRFEYDGFWSGNDALCFGNLAQSICHNDFAPQRVVTKREAATEYFDEVLRELMNIDFNKVDILLLEYGVNDYHAGIKIWEDINSSEAYFTYVYEKGIKLLKETYPDLKIVIVSPTYTWYYNKNGKKMISCEEYNTGYGTLEDYVDAQKKLADSLGVGFIDLYRDAYNHNSLSMCKLYTLDGLHPNEVGRKVICNEIYNYLKDYYD